MANHKKTSKKTTKPNQKAVSPKPPNRSPAVVIYARVESGIGNAFNNHVYSIVPETSLKAVLEIAMKEYMEKRGLWPPRSEAE